MKRLLDVGNCGPDHGALCDVVERICAVEVIQAHGLDDAWQQLTTGSFDLVTVNRLMDRDGSSGLEIIQRIKQDESLRDTPVMLVSNYEDAQDQAVQMGAERGYGKSQLHTEQTSQLLGRFLGS